MAKEQTAQAPVTPVAEPAAEKAEAPKRSIPFDIHDPSEEKMPDEVKTDAAAPESAGEDQPEFPEELMTWAESVGLDKEVLTKLGPEQAEAVRAKLEESMTRLSAKDKIAPAAPISKIDKYAVKLDPDIYDKGFIEVIEGLNAHYSDQLSKIMERLENSDKASKDQRLDSYFKSMGSEYETLLSSKRNRTKVTDEMSVIEAGHRALGKTLPGENELFKRAVRSAFPDHKPTPTAKSDDTAQRVRDQQGKFISKPTHRGNGAVNPEMAARMTVSRFLSEHPETFGQQDTQL